MRFRFVSVVLAVVLFLVGNANAALTLEAKVYPTSVRVGETAILTVTAHGSQDVEAPLLHDLDGVDVRYLGPTSQFSLVNGTASSSVAHRYSVIPRRAGTFRFGPFEVTHAGQTVTARAIPLEVTNAPSNAPTTRAQPAEPIELALTVGDTKPFVGETIPIEITLTVGDVSIDGLNFPQVDGEGFVLGKLPQPDRTRERRAGQVVEVLRFQSTLTALRSGPLFVGETTMQMQVLENTRQRRDPFGGFGGFFGRQQRRRAFVATAPAIELHARALPAEGQPPGFRGAVGHFDLEASVTPTEVRAGDPVTLRTQVRGRGNFASVVAPQGAPLPAFRYYDPTPLPSDDPGVRGFEQVLIPKHERVTEVPAVQFHYFDPDAEAYQTSTRGPFPLQVLPGTQQAAPVVSALGPGETPARVEKLGRDIVYLKDDPGALVPRGQSIAHAIWFWALLALAPLGALLVLVNVRNREALARDPALARAKGAAAAARAAVSKLRNGSGVESFSDRLSEILAEFFAARLGIPPGRIDAATLANTLGTIGIDPATAALLDDLDRVRYTGATIEAAEKARMLDAAERIVDAVQAAPLRHRPTSTAWLGGLVAIALASTAIAAVATEITNPRMLFYEAGSAYQEGRYADAETTYRTLLAQGLESGALWFNLGNSLFKQGRLGAAISAYESARRSLPRDPDIVANLAFARAELAVTESPPSFAVRFGLPIASRATLGELATATAVAWWTLWAAVALAIARPSTGKAPVVCTAALTLFLATNFAYRWVMIDGTDRVIVTASSGDVVRFEPSKDGSRHFDASEGTQLEVTAQRDDWLQIRRSDGLRGWIRTDATTPID